MCVCVWITLSEIELSEHYKSNHFQSHNFEGENTKLTAAFRGIKTSVNQFTCT